ncbi:MAG: DNA cytosine methyltransferase [Lewinellaceae bacterium]|nr:DNA cytosine methyltransferase [Lewinellaceae bacterium]
MSKYIDLFAGCGGLSLGLRNAGWKGIFAVEKDQFAFRTLKHNLIDKEEHFEWPDWLPISSHNIDEIILNYRNELEMLSGEVDLVAGGPPCQGFSSAGKRQEADSRNDLIESYLKFIEVVKPKLIFFENVKGFTAQFQANKTKGRKYSDYVINSLNRDYFVHGELVDFYDYGIPQKRCRFILVGIRRNFAGKVGINASVFFQKMIKNKRQFLVSKKLSITPSLEEAISDLLQANGTVESIEDSKFKIGIYTEAKTNYQRFLRKGKKLTGLVADSHRFANHTLEVRNRFETAIQKRLTGRAYREHFKLTKSTINLLEAKAPAPTLTSLPDDCIHYCEPRILTVREYARIQSFPDWYEFKGKYTTGGPLRVKEVPRYSQIGNAIPPLFGEQVGNTLTELLNND